MINIFKPVYKMGAIELIYLDTEKFVWMTSAIKYYQDTEIQETMMGHPC